MAALRDDGDQKAGRKATNFALITLKTWIYNGLYPYKLYIYILSTTLKWLI
jgi:hypothetical protein